MACFWIQSTAFLLSTCLREMRLDFPVQNKWMAKTIPLGKQAGGNQSCL
jgi:hypothetical protein